jgi:uncharacterized protein YkwD
MLRRIAALAAVLAVVAAPGSSTAGPQGAVGPAGALQAALVGQVNALRTARGLPRLKPSPGLATAAAAHSTQMARLGYFSHNSANGASFSQRIASYYRSSGYRRWAVGENLVWGAPDLSAVRALKLWLASPPHRAILLDPRWRELGLAAVHSASAPGVYGNRPATVITADFGTRAR